MAVLIKGGTVVTAEQSWRADVLCTDGKIQAIGADLDAPGDAEVVGTKIVNVLRHQFGRVALRVDADQDNSWQGVLLHCSELLLRCREYLQSHRAYIGALRKTEKQQVPLAAKGIAPDGCASMIDE